MIKALLTEEANLERETSKRVASSTNAEVRSGPTATTSDTILETKHTSDGTTTESEGQGERLFLPSWPVQRIIRRVRGLQVNSGTQTSTEKKTELFVFPAIGS